VLLMLWGARGKSRIADSAATYIFAGSTLALAAVLYLAYASFFVLKEVCPLCATTYVAVIGLFIVSGGVSSVPMSSLPLRALRDLRTLVATPAALIVSIVFVAATAWGTSAFPRAEERPTVAPPPPMTQTQQTELERWWEVQPKANVPWDNAGAKVLIVEFTDFECPHCRAQYFAYKPILDKYAGRPADVKFVLREFPLSSECNSVVPSNMHAASCAAAAGVVMARSRGTQPALVDWLFLHQDELTPAVVKRAIAEVGRIPDYDAQYLKAIQEVKTDVAIGASQGINSTPTFYINGRKIPGGGLPPQYFEGVIELELQHAK
jgi:hypothetical protein